ncbi:hypothetical protein N8198_04820 [Gammaproteobacteria bacterium]|nr:hypothetical protein [Gammaproteobacteria bacterium]
MATGHEVNRFLAGESVIQQDSHPPGVGQLTDAYGQHGLIAGEVCGHLFERIGDACRHFDAAGATQA